MTMTVPLPSANRRDYDDTIIDPVAVAMAVAGTRRIKLTPRERAEVVRQLLARGVSAGDIPDHLRAG